MPVYLHEIDDFSELETCKSVLIVPCRFCPAASLAVGKKAPYFQPLRSLLRTPVYEQYLEKVRTKMQKRGIRTKVFKSCLYNWRNCITKDFSGLIKKAVL